LQRQGQHLFLLKEKLKLSFPLAAGAQETVTLHSKQNQKSNKAN
jgi:hypothetical protein